MPRKLCFLVLLLACYCKSTGGEGSQGLENSGDGGDPAAAAGGSGPASKGGRGAVAAAGEAGAPTDATNLGFILGPERDGQPPLVIGSDRVRVLADLDVFQMDVDGNFFTATEGLRGFEFNIVKYSPDFEELWTVSIAGTGVGHRSSNFSARADGSLFFGGRSSFNDVNRASVGKLTSTGALDWLQVWEAGDESLTIFTVVTKDGAVIAGGTCSGLVEGAPADVNGGPWLARYEDDGTRTWLRQYKPIGPLYQLRIDGEGHAFLFGLTGTITAKEADGEQQEPRNAMDGLDNAVGADRVYTLGNFGLTAYSASDGKELWSRGFEPERSAIVDGLMWTGTLDDKFAIGNEHVVFASDSIYLTGLYTNTHEGTAQKSVYLYVGRYDLDGNRIWFQQLDYEDAAGIIGSISIDADGNPNFALRANPPGQPNGLIIKLSREDGSLL